MRRVLRQALSGVLLAVVFLIGRSWPRGRPSPAAAGTGPTAGAPSPVRASRWSRSVRAVVYVGLVVLIGGGAVSALKVVNASPADEPLSDIRLYAISDDVAAADLVVEYSPAGTGGEDASGSGSLWILPEFDIELGQKVQWRIYINGPLAYADVDQLSVTLMDLKVERYGARGTGITGWTVEEPRWFRVPSEEVDPYRDGIHLRLSGQIKRGGFAETTYTIPGVGTTARTDDSFDGEQPVNLKRTVVIADVLSPRVRPSQIFRPPMPWTRTCDGSPPVLPAAQP